MGGARDVGWVAAGLVLAAGACYCVYRLTCGRRRGGRRLRLRPSRSAEDLTNGSYDDVLNAEQLQKLLYLLESTEDPAIIERALVTVGNSAAFSANQVVIRELGGIPVVGSKINSPNQSIKEKALNALNNLSVNVENQIKIKVYVNQVCEDVLSGPLNSAVQLAGLRLLTNMTVTNDHQHMLRSYITDLFHVLLTGNGSTKVQVLKLLLNLSENPAMTDGLLGAQVDSSFLSLYDGHVAKEILLRVLTLFQNINNCLKKEGCLVIHPTFTKGSLFYLLYGEECAQKMRALVYHQDADVKEKGYPDTEMKPGRNIFTIEKGFSIWWKHGVPIGYSSNVHCKRSRHILPFSVGCLLTDGPTLQGNKDPSVPQFPQEKDCGPGRQKGLLSSPALSPGKIQSHQGTAEPIRDYHSGQLDSRITVFNH